uniref:Uncharacterized protein n=1 Tax=Klebsiella pneumoniae TaxID=573 RepID=A0A8B0SXR8_KLEPN|nr:hypothetical protein [Klebsiella pneumoniae]
MSSEQKKPDILTVLFFSRKRLLKSSLSSLSLVCISVYIGKRMNEGVGLFHKSVKIAVLNPSALNEQYLKSTQWKKVKVISLIFAS